MSIQLTSEQFRALQSQSLPVVIEDPESRSRYVIISREEYRCLTEDEFRREVQRGIDDAERGELEKWDVEAIIAEAERRFAARTQS
jgi:hypothetical protein